jgi:murein DD-endopeptidase MepM/ murein hydrolase activator NlpD
VLDHGNGWRTTYSQLQDNVLVSMDDVVTSGQIIGGVGEPSIYSVLLGSHVDFGVSRDDVPVDPADVLGEQ